MFKEFDIVIDPTTKCEGVVRKQSSLITDGSILVEYLKGTRKDLGWEVSATSKARFPEHHFPIESGRYYVFYDSSQLLPTGKIYGAHPSSETYLFPDVNHL